MAKKVRRVKKKSKKKAAASKPDTSISGTTLADPVSEPLTVTDQFRFDYAYVVKDLRRVLILAGAMFALLIVLNLILQ